MIHITFIPEKLELRVEGHSDFDKIGKDIVCAGISTLFYTLGEALNDSKDMLRGGHTFEDENGRGLIRCEPYKKYQLNIETMYKTVLTGMHLMAVNYPRNVEIEIIE